MILQAELGSCLPSPEYKAHYKECSHQCMLQALPRLVACQFSLNGHLHQLIRTDGSGLRKDCINFFDQKCLSVIPFSCFAPLFVALLDILHNLFHLVLLCQIPLECLLLFII